MTQTQEEHLLEICHEFSRLTGAKYRKGAQEHGGNLWELPMLQLLDNAIEEAIDQVTYLLTLKKKMQQFITEGETE